MIEPMPSLAWSGAGEAIRSAARDRGIIGANMADESALVRPINGGSEDAVLPLDRPLPAGPDSEPLPDALFAVPIAVLDAILSRIPPVPLPIRHFWGPGFLVREMLIPAGTLIVARRYTVDHVCICSAGSITVWSDGVEPLVVEAPFSVQAASGVQRVGYAHEDTIWATVMPNPEGLTDPEAVLDACAEVTPLAYRELPFTELLALTTPEVRRLIGGTEA